MSNAIGVRIIASWCKGCGICVAFCRTNVLEMNAESKAVVVRPDDCTGCRDCEIRCPDMAITVARATS